MHVQVINLDRNQERMTRIAGQLDSQGVAFSRLSASDGRRLSPQELRYYSPLRCLVYYGRRLSSGEVGCFRSHQRAADEFLATDEEYGLVLEDDADIPPKFRAAMERLVATLQIEADPEWELVNLGNAPKHDKHCADVGRSDAVVRLVAAHVFPKRTTALLWSRTGARRFIAETQTIRAPVDQHLHSALSARSTGLATVPALVPHAELPSDINGEPDAALVRQVDKPSTWYSFRRAMRRRRARRNIVASGS